jgi:hypothetical protein
LRDAKRRHIAGFRVVVSWPQDGYAPPPTHVPASPRARVAGIIGTLLLVGGICAVSFAVLAQQHAPQPSSAAAGSTGPSLDLDRSLSRSEPVRVDIPAIGVHSKLLHLGVTADGAIQVPSLVTDADLAAWYKYSATPGQIGTSIIEGHVDDLQGPAVFFRLVTGVREFLKSSFPADTVYGQARYAALRLITCGGTFDYATGHYLSSTVVFASLASARR